MVLSIADNKDYCMSLTGKRTDPIYQAQAILAIRDHSIAEITLKLKKKGFTAPDIQTALGWLEQHKLVNDQQFAERYVDSLLRSKPVGPRWLHAKLREKGVEPSLIAATLAKLYSKELENHLAKQATAEWQRTHTTSANDPQKLFRFLISRGFSADVIQEQLQIVTEE